MLHNEIKYGYANAFVKALIRAYIPRIPFIGYGVANGFVTRHITANDIGNAYERSPENRTRKVEAETLTAIDIVPGIDDSIPVQSVPVQSVPAFTSQEESVSAVSEPKQTEPINPTSVYTETEKQNNHCWRRKHRNRKMMKTKMTRTISGISLKRRNHLPGSKEK